MITYEQIKSANERVNRLEIVHTDKDGKRVVKHYACVSERVQAFREMIPNGTIETSYVLQKTSDGKNEVIFTAKCFDEDGRLLSTGTAEEVEGRGAICRTSYIEVAETSAVGRAIGYIGIGSEESMASAEEMAVALAEQTAPAKKQNAPKEPTPEDVKKRAWRVIADDFKAHGQTSKDAQEYIEKLHGKPITEVTPESLKLDVEIVKAYFEKLEEYENNGKR